MYTQLILNLSKQPVFAGAEPVTAIFCTFAR